MDVDRNLELQFTLSPIKQEDEPFLRRLYRDVREIELAAMEWADAQIEAFCDMQFNFRAISHKQYQPAIQSSLVRVGVVPVGRLDLVLADEEWVLVNVELLALWRGRGLGRQLLEALQDKATDVNASIALKVDIGSRAVALYRRCGFETVASDGFRHQLLWRPLALSQSTTTGVLS